jgi:hypothetical protein
MCFSHILTARLNPDKYYTSVPGEESNLRTFRQDYKRIYK